MGRRQKREARVSAKAKQRGAQVVNRGKKRPREEKEQPKARDQPLFSLAAAHQGDHDDDEVVIPDMDADSYDEMPTFALRERKRRKKEIEKKANEAEEWEEARHKVEFIDERPDKLPIKQMDGSRVVPPKVVKKELEKAEDEMEVQESEESEEVVVETELEKAARSYAEMQEQKERVAQIAAEVLETPETKLRLLDELRELSGSSEHRIIKKAALLSLAAVFADILPGYAIRLPTAEELAVPVSKDVKALRDYETRLLRSYQHFVDYLLRLSLRKDPLRNTATQCAQTLLVARPNFNFRVSLVRLLIRSCDDKDERVRQLGKKGLSTLFKTDVRVECSPEAVRAVSHYAKQRKFRIHEEVLAPFEALSLTAPLSEGHDVLRGITPKKEKKRLSKTERKNLKANKALVKELEENEAETQRRKLREGHTDMLKNEPSPLLPVALAGLARFSHLVNVALLSDLLTALKTLMKNPELSLLAKLHCARTAFHALKLQGQTLEVDLAGFYTALYALIYETLPALNLHSELLPLALECFEMMFAEQKHLAVERVAAFIKRFLTSSLYAPPHAAISILALVKRLLMQYPKTQQLLENDVRGSGMFAPLATDPEQAHAFATSAWELSLHATSPHPTLKAFALLIMRQPDSPAHAHTPQRLAAFYAPNVSDNVEPGHGVGYCYPPPPPPTVHLLAKKVEKYERQKQQNKKMPTKAWLIERHHETNSFVSGLDAKLSQLLPHEKDKDFQAEVRAFYEISALESM